MVCSIVWWESIKSIECVCVCAHVCMCAFCKQIVCIRMRHCTSAHLALHMVAMQRQQQCDIGWYLMKGLENVGVFSVCDGPLWECPFGPLALRGGSTYRLPSTSYVQDVFRIISVPHTCWKDRNCAKCSPNNEARNYTHKNCTARIVEECICKVAVAHRQKIHPKKSTQDQKVFLNKFFWTTSVGFLTRVTWKRAKARANFSKKFV